MKTFINVAQMRLATLQAGQTVSWGGYYTNGDAGGNYGIVKAGAHTDDGGSVFSLVNGNYVEANLQGSKVSVLKFGAKGNTPSFDDAPAMIALHDYIQNTGWVEDSSGLYPDSSVQGFKKEMGFAPRQFYLGQTVRLTSYDNTDFEGAIFLPHADFDLADYAFHMDLYNCKIKRFRIANFTKGVRLYINNIDGQIVRFEDIQAGNCDTLFYIDSRSAIITIKDFKFDLIRHVVEIEKCDKLSFKEGWFNAGQFANNYDSHFIMDSSDSNAPSLFIDDMLYVPRPQTFTKCSIVGVGTPTNNNHHNLRITGLLAGAEIGRVAIVNNFAKATTGRGTHINITDSATFTATNPTVRLMELPNAVSFTNQSGGIEESHVDSLITWDDSIRTFAEAEAAVALGTHPEIWLNGYRPNNFDNLPRANLSTLNKLVVTPNKTFRAYPQGVGTSAQDLNFPNNVRFSRGKVWKIKATNLGNPAADRYTEVIVAGNFAGTLLSFVTIIQGTTVAPIFEAVAGQLRIKSNSGTNDFAVEIEQLCDATEAFT